MRTPLHSSLGWGKNPLVYASTIISLRFQKPGRFYENEVFRVSSHEKRLLSSLFLAGTVSAHGSGCRCYVCTSLTVSCAVRCAWRHGTLCGPSPDTTRTLRGGWYPSMLCMWTIPGLNTHAAWRMVTQHAVHVDHPRFKHARCVADGTPACSACAWQYSR